MDSHLYGPTFRAPRSGPTRPQLACWIFMTSCWHAMSLRKWRVLKVIPQVATPGAEFAVYDCLVCRWIAKLSTDDSAADSRRASSITRATRTSRTMQVQLVGLLGHGQRHVLCQSRCINDSHVRRMTATLLRTAWPCDECRKWVSADRLHHSVTTDSDVVVVGRRPQFIWFAYFTSSANRRRFTTAGYNVQLSLQLKVD